MELERDKLRCKYFFVIHRVNCTTTAPPLTKVIAKKVQASKEHDILSIFLHIWYCFVSLRHFSYLSLTSTIVYQIRQG